MHPAAQRSRCPLYAHKDLSKKAAAANALQRIRVEPVARLETLRRRKERLGSFLERVEAYTRADSCSRIGITLAGSHRAQPFGDSGGSSAARNPGSAEELHGTIQGRFSGTVAEWTAHRDGSVDRRPRLHRDPRRDHAAIKPPGLSDLDPFLRYDAANDPTVNAHFPGYKVSLNVLCVCADGEVVVWHFNTAVYAAL